MIGRICPQLSFEGFKHKIIHIIQNESIAIKQQLDTLNHLKYNHCRNNVLHTGENMV